LRDNLSQIIAARNGLGDGVGQFGAETPQPGSVTLANLSAEQIETLNSGRAFVNRVEPVVAVMLLDSIFAGVAVPSVGLDR